jgi:glycine dehydrogenase subunit 2
LQEGKYKLQHQSEKSIGHLSSFHGNFGIYLRAYLYFKLHGTYGLRRIAENAILNANYIKNGLSKILNVPYPQPCMHEFVVQADRFLPQGIKASDLAKRLLDYGIHSPTTYFPLIVKECLLIEPTESESKETLDRFIEVMGKIAQECERDPHFVKTAPHTTPVGRLDEVLANKQLKLTGH